jgi:serine/threonine-protein kinase
MQISSSPAIDSKRPSASAQLGKYRLVATLGQGGMGTVHLASASGLGQFRKLLVVKELRQDLLWKDSSIAMFIDEARLAARLDHPNVVQTFEAGEQNGRYFLAMEYLDGQPLNELAQHMAAKGGIPLELHVHMLCDVLAGLQYAHELRDYDGSRLHVVHRDISPHNVFITYHGQVKIVDFGVAKARNASSLTNPGMFKGKFAYAAPEQVFGRAVDARADVFAVGVMLWEAIAKRRFVEGVPTPEAFKARANGREPRIVDVVPDVEPLLADICNRALAVDPDARFPSAEAFRSELQDYLLLTASRVEGSDVAQLMRSVFESDRATMHRVIERAMKECGASDSTMEALPLMRSAAGFDKEQTLVADLTGLSQLSQMADDAQIRARYEHSKVTAVRRTPLVEPAEPPRSQWPRKLWAAVLGAAAISGAAGAIVDMSRPSQPPEAPLSITVPPPSMPVTAPPPTPTRASVAPGAAAAATAAAALPEAAQPSPPRVRVSHAPAPVRPSRKAVAPAHPAVAADSGSTSQSSASAAEPAMGSDLHVAKRALRRIDVEDPYQ